MTPVPLILCCFAFVCFAIATFNVPSRWNLVAAGLAFWVASEIFYGWSHIHY